MVPLFLAIWDCGYKVFRNGEWTPHFPYIFLVHRFMVFTSEATLKQGRTKPSFDCPEGQLPCSQIAGIPLEQSLPSVLLPTRHHFLSCCVYAPHSLPSSLHLRTAAPFLSDVGCNLGLSRPGLMFLGVYFTVASWSWTLLLLQPTPKTVL